MEEIRQSKIQVFIPEFDEDDSPGVREMRENIPFAVVGSERMLEVGGKKVRARQYPWGVVEGVCGGGGEREGNGTARRGNLNIVFVLLKDMK